MVDHKRRRIVDSLDLLVEAVSSGAGALASSFQQVVDERPTLRDAFALAALAGLLSDITWSFESWKGLAADAYAAADAMLEQRRSDEPPPSAPRLTRRAPGPRS